MPSAAPITFKNDFGVGFSYGTKIFTGVIFTVMFGLPFFVLGFAYSNWWMVAAGTAVFVAFGLFCRFLKKDKRSQLAFGRDAVSITTEGDVQSFPYADIQDVISQRSNARSGRYPVFGALIRIKGQFYTMDDEPTFFPVDYGTSMYDVKHYINEGIERTRAALTADKTSTSTAWSA